MKDLLEKLTCPYCQEDTPICIKVESRERIHFTCAKCGWIHCVTHVQTEEERLDALLVEVMNGKGNQ